MALKFCSVSQHPFGLIGLKKGCHSPFTPLISLQPMMMILLGVVVDGGAMIRVRKEERWVVVATIILLLLCFVVVIIIIILHLSSPMYYKVFNYNTTALWGV
ncbi:hypothetical protein HKD37_11G031836 [Glycine soja]